MKNIVMLTCGLLMALTTAARDLPRCPVPPVPIPGNAALHVLTGAEARQHFRTLVSRHPAAFAQAQRNLRDRGWVPTDQIAVLKTPGFAVGLTTIPTDGGESSFSKTPDFSIASTTITTDEGEVVFWSWDDGNPDTWEGEVWAENYSTGAKQLQEAQVDIETDAQVLWENVLYFERPKPVYQEGGLESSPLIILDSVQAHTPVTPMRLEPLMQDWVACVAGCCTVAAAACVGTAMGWPACFALVCGGGCQVGCALQEIIRRL